jgi:hypothetical protein
MNHDHPNLDDVLELAGSDDEKARLTQVWSELEAATVEEPPRAMKGEFQKMLRTMEILPQSRGMSWARAASIFGIGLLTGALGMSVAARFGTAPKDLPATSHATAIAAALPLQTTGQRLAAMHVVGDLAKAEPAARAALIQRVLRDQTPAVQLAAIDHLDDLELSTAEIEVLAHALPELGAPIVQVMLLDLVTPTTGAPVAEVLRRLSRDPSTDTTVRRHADRALALNPERNDI